MKKRCERCNGGGFVATKHGSMRCPHCNGSGQSTTWRDWLVDAVFLGSVLGACVVGHSWISAGM